ncbi:MAG: hypothetical protein AB1447_05520, partial [Bacillota bacterium]
EHAYPTHPERGMSPIKNGDTPLTNRSCRRSYLKFRLREHAYPIHPERGMSPIKNGDTPLTNRSCRRSYLKFRLREHAYPTHPERGMSPIKDNILGIIIGLLGGGFLPKIKKKSGAFKLSDEFG